MQDVDEYLISWRIFLVVFQQDNSLGYKLRQDTAI